MAKTVAAGALTLPTPLPAAGPRGGLTFISAKELPEFCRVSALIKPSKDSKIKFEVWMPASNWNGKFAGLGNGAMGGSISYGSMTAALSRGYAASSTDTRHEGTGPDGSYALGHREKLIDLGYRERRAAWVLSGFWFAFLASRLGMAFLLHRNVRLESWSAWLLVRDRPRGCGDPREKGGKDGQI